jgi:hypothetical protein
MNFLKKSWKFIVAVVGGIVGLIMLKQFFQKDLKADAKLQETKLKDAVLEEKKSANSADIKALEGSNKRALEDLSNNKKLGSLEAKEVEDYYKKN